MSRSLTSSAFDVRRDFGRQQGALVDGLDLGLGGGIPGPVADHDGFDERRGVGRAPFQGIGVVRRAFRRAGQIVFM